MAPSAAYFSLSCVTKSEPPRSLETSHWLPLTARGCIFRLLFAFHLLGFTELLPTDAINPSIIIGLTLAIYTDTKRIPTSTTF
jgi:hypothetical protein